MIGRTKMAKREDGGIKRRGSEVKSLIESQLKRIFQKEGGTAARFSDGERYKVKENYFGKEEI